MCASYVLGVDGGGTKTHAIFATDTGDVVGFGEAGGSNIYDIPFDDAVEQIRLAIQMARQRAGLESVRCAAAVLSLCGADWPEDFTDFAHALLESAAADQLDIVNDAVGGLSAGLPVGPGVSVICGTGAAIASRGYDGTEWHTSFWQMIGAAHDLARAGIAAVYRAELGLLPPTALTGRILQHLGFASVPDMLHQVTRRDSPRRILLGPIAGIVLDCADAGDPVALPMVVAHAAELGQHGVIAARRVGIADDPFTLVLGGGLLRHPSQLFPDTIIGEIRAACPGASVTRLIHDPVIGALRRAAMLAGFPWGTEERTFTYRQLLSDVDTDVDSPELRP